jgi:hypothetical protein
MITPGLLRDPDIVIVMVISILRAVINPMGQHQRLYGSEHWRRRERHYRYLPHHRDPIPMQRGTR